MEAGENPARGRWVRQWIEHRERVSTEVFGQIRTRELRNFARFVQIGLTT